MTDIYGLPSWDIDTWTARLRDLLHDCVGSAPIEEANRLREVAAALRGAPETLTGELRVPAHDAVEAMLACGAGVSVALALVSERKPFILSRGGNGACLASMVQPGGAVELIAEASTVALALLAVQLTVLLAVAEQAREAAAGRMVAGGRMH